VSSATGLVQYEFTAKMEDDLDEIAGGRNEPLPYLRTFYFGNGQLGLKTMVSERLGDIDARDINSIPIGADGEGREVVLRVGRYGPYVERGEERASVPEDIAPDELTIERATELLAQPSQERTLGTDPASGLEVIARAGRFGPYVQLGQADPDAKEKPKTGSLFKTMSLDTITLDEALRLLSLPRVVGVAEDGEEIVAQNGRYGPYIKKGSDTRSLESEEQLFTVTEADARALLAEPKRRRGQRAAAQPPLREFGADPASGKPIVLKEGRFGPYVTDGETNASLRRGDSPETITHERAVELLQDRRDRAATEAPKRKPARRKAAPKKKTSPKGRAGSEG
jgi:DNA topoisomerase-1